MKNSGNTIFLTGGGTGIGRELARKWHDAGNTVIVAARTEEDLKETAEGRENIHIRVFDVADAAGIEPFARKLLADFPRINVLVNNAGIMPFEDITEKRDLGDAEKVVAINLLGPIRLTDAVVEHLKEADDAAIVNVTSGLAFVPLPKAPTYSATKAALHSYTQALRYKLDGQVEVIELAPPGVQTELTPGQSQRDGYMPLDDFIEEVMNLFEQNPTPAEICVEQVKPFRNAEANGKVGEFIAMLGKR